MKDTFIEIIPKRYGFRIFFLDSGVMIQRYYHDGFSLCRGESYFLPKVLAEKIIRKEFFENEAIT